MAKNITKSAKTITAQKRNVGRPPKGAAKIYSYHSINVTNTCRDELDAVRLEISAKMGFGVSYADAILHILKVYKDAKED